MTDKYLRHLMLREGVRNAAYLDSLGKLTVGVGHLVMKEDGIELGEIISDERVEDFLHIDARDAWEAAEWQARELGHPNNVELIEALACVSFQLGVRWYKIHRRTWQHLLKGRWAEAAKEVQNSLWYKQTPVRVRDFQQALCGLGN